MNIIREKTFYRSLFLLALPIALQNFSTFAIGLSDTLMLRSLGNGGIAGVYLANTVQTLLQVFTTGVESAILILATQYWGRGDTESICRTAAIGWHVSLLFGIAVALPCALWPTGVLSLFTTDRAAVESGAPYLSLLALSFPIFCLTQVLIAALRSVEATAPGAVLSTLSLGSNLLLNLLLIFGNGPLPALGARGAALATLITRLLELTGAILYILVRERRLRLRPAHLWSLSLPLLRDFARCGAPVMLGQLIWAANLLLSTAIMGRQGANVVAGTAVANAVNSLSYILISGMAAAIGILTGKTVGSGETRQLRAADRPLPSDPTGRRPGPRHDPRAERDGRGHRLSVRLSQRTDQERGRRPLRPAYRRLPCAAPVARRLVRDAAAGAPLSRICLPQERSAAEMPDRRRQGQSLSLGAPSDTLPHGLMLFLLAVTGASPFALHGLFTSPSHFSFPCSL